MKLLIIDTYYAKFLSGMYQKTSGLANLAYSAQWQCIVDQYFGTADFYSRNLHSLGINAEEIIVNCFPLQRKWADENDSRVAWNLPDASLARVGPIPIVRLNRNRQVYLSILTDQVKAIQPDVVYVQDIGFLPPAYIQDVLRPMVKVIAGQCAYSLPDASFMRAYDILFSSLPNQVATFRRLGVKAEYLPIAFEPRVLERMENTEPVYDVSYIGGFAGVHNERSRFLTELLGMVPVAVWGYGIEHFNKQSAIRQAYQGEAWGLDMYRIRARSKICINKHSSISGEYANNMSLYECTGVGSLLLTDAKSNLGDLFVDGIEVVSYKDARDCADKIRYYLSHEGERRQIASAGQRRTLRDHTYAQCMQELVRHLTAMLAS